MNKTIMGILFTLLLSAGIGNAIVYTLEGVAEFTTSDGITNGAVITWCYDCRDLSFICPISWNTDFGITEIERCIVTDMPSRTIVDECEPNKQCGFFVSNVSLEERMKNIEDRLNVLELLVNKIKDVICKHSIRMCKLI